MPKHGVTKATVAHQRALVSTTLWTSALVVAVLISPFAFIFHSAAVSRHRLTSLWICESVVQQLAPEGSRGLKHVSARALAGG
jgi:hypothetical protein